MIALYLRQLSAHGMKFDLEATDDVTGQDKVEMFDCWDWMRLTGKIFMFHFTFSKANESAICMDGVSGIHTYHYQCYVTTGRYVCVMLCYACYVTQDNL